MMSAPMSAPSTEPSPPARLPPPMTTAAMMLSSRPDGAGRVAHRQPRELHQARRCRRTRRPGRRPRASPAPRGRRTGARPARSSRRRTRAARGACRAAARPRRRPAGTAATRRAGTPSTPDAAGSRASSSLSQEVGASIFWSCASPLATPRTTSMVPRVTMNGTTLSRVTSAPLSAPQPTPAAMPASAASTGGAPARRTAAITTVASAMIAPTERSMPPDTITMVMPSAATATMVVWRKMVSRFAGSAKLSPRVPAEQHREQMKTATRPADRAQVLAQHGRRQSGPEARAAAFRLRRAPSLATSAVSARVTLMPPRCPARPRAPGPARRARATGRAGPRSPAAHDRDAIAHAEQLGQIARHHDDRLGRASGSRCVRDTSASMRS